MGSILVITPKRRWQISFVQYDFLREFLGLKPVVVHEGYNFRPDPVDILSFDNIFVETDIAKGMLFTGKRSGIFLKFTMDVEPGYRFLKNFR